MKKIINLLMVISLGTAINITKASLSSNTSVLDTSVLDTSAVDTSTQSKDGKEETASEASAISSARTFNSDATLALWKGLIDVWKNDLDDGRLQVIYDALKNGADPNGLNKHVLPPGPSNKTGLNENETPSGYVLSKINPDSKPGWKTQGPQLFKKLLLFGADPVQSNPWGEGVMHMYLITVAADNLNVEAIKDLFSASPKLIKLINSKGTLGDTVLNRFAHSRYLGDPGTTDVAKLLLSMGADPYIANDFGRNFFENALRQQQEWQPISTRPSKARDTKLRKISEIENVINVVRNYKKQVEEQMKSVPELEAFPPGLVPLIAEFHTPAEPKKQDQEAEEDQE